MTQTDNGLQDAHRIRKASDEDGGSIADILGSAFSNDPVFNWFCPGADSFYPRMFLSEFQNHYQAHGHVFINEDKTGAAMWLPPGVTTEVSFSWQQIGLIVSMIRHAGIVSLKRGQYLSELMSREHLAEPHYYLHAIGAHLDHQGRGIGSALLKQGTAMCDKESMPAYLESSNERNNPLYERYGFNITKEIQLPEGPKLWLMTREAR